MAEEIGEARSTGDRVAGLADVAGDWSVRPLLRQAVHATGLALRQLSHAGYPVWAAARELPCTASRSSSSAVQLTTLGAPFIVLCIESPGRIHTTHDQERGCYQEVLGAAKSLGRSHRPAVHAATVTRLFTIHATIRLRARASMDRGATGGTVGHGGS